MAFSGIIAEVQAVSSLSVRSSADTHLSSPATSRELPCCGTRNTFDSLDVGLLPMFLNAWLKIPQMAHPTCLKEVYEYMVGETCAPQNVCTT